MALPILLLTASVSLAIGAIRGALNFCKKSELGQFHEMALHSKGRGVKHLSTEDKDSFIFYKDARIATSEIATLMGSDHNQESSSRQEGLPEKGITHEKRALAGEKN
jgi:hypothetical protein